MKLRGSNRIILLLIVLLPFKVIGLEAEAESCLDCSIESEELLDATEQTFSTLFGLVDGNTARLEEQNQEISLINSGFEIFFQRHTDLENAVDQKLSDLKNSGSRLESEVAKMKDDLNITRELLGQAAELITETEKERAKTEALTLVRKREETTIYVAPEVPSVIVFDRKVLGGFKRKNAKLALSRGEVEVAIFAEKDLPPEGESLIVRLENGSWIGLRILPADTDNPRDIVTEIKLD